MRIIAQHKTMKTKTKTKKIQSIYIEIGPNLKDSIKDLAEKTRDMGGYPCAEISKVFKINFEKIIKNIKP